MYTDLSPIEYIEPVFRPPSEAKSLILPVTNGCSWNKCSFCEMYTEPQKKFQAHKKEDVTQMLQRCAEAQGAQIRRVFLADGDATVLPTRRLLEILSEIQQYLPNVHRISSYCLPRNLYKKSPAELKELADAGLKLLYVGAESGDDFVLERVNKGESFQSTADALNKIKEAGIKRSVMILTGLGGSDYSAQHAKNSALLMNETQPEFVSTLVLSFPRGKTRFQTQFTEWKEVDWLQTLNEMYQFINTLELTHTIFRSDHASNRLALKGTLNQDKAHLLEQITQTIAHAKEQPDLLWHASTGVL